MHVKGRVHLAALRSVMGRFSYVLPLHNEPNIPPQRYEASREQVWESQPSGVVISTSLPPALEVMGLGWASSVVMPLSHGHI